MDQAVNNNTWDTCIPHQTLLVSIPASVDAELQSSGDGFSNLAPATRMNGQDAVSGT